MRRTVSRSHALTFPHALGLGLLLLTAGARAEQTGPFSPAGAWAEKAYEAARARSQSETNSAEAAWQFGRACFDLAEYAKKNPERGRLANEGMAACRELIAREPKIAAAHYYLALNIGQLARAKRLGALRLVSEMELELRWTRDLDENFDYAGPDRALGLLYLDAPGWPTSIGSRSKARQHLQRAIQLHPEYPGNRLSLLEAHLKWSNWAEARKEVSTLQELWPKARKQFSGESWQPSWLDWEKQREQAQGKLAEKPAESPKSRGSVP